MALPQKQLETLILEAFPDAKLKINDLAGDNDHFAVEIESNIFEGKNRIQQHQLVFNALQGKMGNELHALSIKTIIPTKE